MPEATPETKRSIIPIAAAALVALATLGAVLVWRLGVGDDGADATESAETRASDDEQEPADSDTDEASDDTADEPEWTLLWSDEFDDGSLDPAWSAYHSTYGDGNNELQCHTPDNVSERNGVLEITARRERVRCPNGSSREFTSGFLGTRETGTYFPRAARYEMRAKIPHGQGLWPAFWLRHRDGSKVVEVDVMEYFHSQVPGVTSQSVHVERLEDDRKALTYLEDPTESDWHTWAVEITDVDEGVEFRFFTDDVETFSFVDTEPVWATPVDPTATFDIAVNLSVGGNWVGDPDDPLGVLAQRGRCAQDGSYPNGCDATGIRRAEFPETYTIDYVRVSTR